MIHFELLLLWYHVATGLSSFSNKTHSNIKAPKTLCSPFLDPFVANYKLDLPQAHNEVILLPRSTLRLSVNL